LTQWSLVFRAHQDRGDAAKVAQEELLLRYGGAIRRYLRSVVRDDDAVDEMCQEFAYRFVRGSFRNANPSSGRFRDYVKTAVAHLLADWRGNQFRTRSLDSVSVDHLVSPGPDAEQQFENQWRSELIEQAWERLAAFEAEREGRWLYAALRYGAEHPDKSAAEMAAALGAQLNRPLTGDAVYKSQERGRDKFADLLLEEVALSLGAPTPEELHDEVIELGLLRYCQGALARRGLHHDAP
jgi:RNA polymerase sigma-70 factor (ECF subfamily)